MNEIYILLIVSILVLIRIIYDFHHRNGINRIIFGEFYRDMGLAILVGTAFKYNYTDTSFIALVIISSILLGVGARMKYKK
ncbi:MAG: hypothetical protein ABIF18_00735 [archaeon]